MRFQLKIQMLKIIICIVFITLASFSYAQNILNLVNNGNEDIPIPLITELDIHWWKYFESSESEIVLNERIKKFTDALSIAIEIIDNNVDLNKKKAIIIELLNQFQKQKFLKLDVKVLNEIKLQEAYSIQELMKINAEKNKIIVLLNKNQSEIASLNENISSKQSQIDRFKINYFASNEITRKQEIALNWIDARLMQALDEIRVQRVLMKNENINSSINANTKLITLASERVVLNKANKEFDDSQSLIKKRNKTRLKIDKLNLELARDFTDSLESRLNNDLIRLDLVLALIDESKFSLMLNKKRQILLLEKLFNNSPYEIDQLEKLIIDTKEELKKGNNLLIEWQKQSQDTLLASILNTTKYTKVELKLEEKKKRKAEAILKENEHINTLLGDIDFNLIFLEKRFNEIDKGYSKFWNSIKEFSVNTKESLTNIIYEPLFTVNDYPITLLPLIKLALIILLGFIASKVVSYLMVRYEKKHKLNRVKNRSSLYLIHAIVRYIIIFVTILASFSALGINLGNITLIAGALSVGIGFGLQNLVSNFVSGLTIMFDKTLSVGDYIQLEDGVTGVVKEIRARSTRINTNDNIDVIIPNSDMVTNKVINWTLKESIRRIRIPFGVAYGTNKELVKKAALEAASKVEYTLTHMQGKDSDVYLTDYGDSSVNYTLLVWVAHYGLRRPGRMKSHYLWELDNAFEKYDIIVPFPQRDVNLNIIDKTEITNQNILE
jgi:small-conductance mechanosensitive channel